MLCSRLRRSTNAQLAREGARTHRVRNSRVSTCKQNGLAHERLRYPKPSFCGRFGLPKLRNIVRRSVSYHWRRRSTAMIKLTSCHVAGGRRWALASPCARSTRSVQSSAKGTRRLVPLLSALMAERVTNLCKASFGEWYSLREHDFSSHDDFERGRRREMSSLKNEREQSLPLETAPQPTKHVHLRSVACHRGWFWQRHFVFK